MKDLNETRAALSNLIKKAKTKEELKALEARITRHYNAGTINACHLASLDGMIMHRIARIN